jgi:hypothetical protein
MRMRGNSALVPIRARAEAPVEGHAVAGDIHRCGERGSARLKTVVWIALLGAFIFVCVKVVPVLFSEYQFQDAMQTTARFATINRQSPDEIRKTLIQEAKSKDIPVQPEDIHVTNDAGNVKISADYSVTVDLQVYQLTLNLHPSATNNVL